MEGEHEAQESQERGAFGRCEVLRWMCERAERDAKVKRAEPRSFGGGTDPIGFLEGPDW